MAAVPCGPARLHMTVPEPSPVRMSALSATVPLMVPASGRRPRTTGVLVAGAQVTVSDRDWAAVAGAGKTGVTWYVYAAPATPPTSVSRVAEVVATSSGDAPARVRVTWYVVAPGTAAQDSATCPSAGAAARVAAGAGAGGAGDAGA